MALLCFAALSASPAAAQSAAGGAGAGGSLESPAAAPEVYSRDPAGNVTVRAVRLREPLVIDGLLDEDAYREVPHLGPLIQQDPHEGEPASEATDLWIFFDDKNLYISAHCWDSHPERLVANELRRDQNDIFQNDNLAIAIDTFHDQRNGVMFQTNALGGLRDQEIYDERNTNIDWNAIWDVRTRRTDRGWTAEFVIPFKSLRYRGGAPQTWGINIRRVIRWKNETQFLSPVPKSYGTAGVFKFSSAATLVGLELPVGRPPLELKPYALTAATERRAGQSLVQDGQGDVGFDFKYGLTKGLTADFTYNTDFAQVEADDQQVNLTRFSLFFPEKRDFFLEGQGIFQFGNAASTRGQDGAANLTPVIFFSRRIGLNEGQQVPILAGGRVTGHVGDYVVGAFHVRSRDEPAAGAVRTDFSVLRLRRDVLRRSSIGMIATNRSTGLSGVTSNQVVGADASLAFFDNVLVTSYYARSRTPGERRDEASYFGQAAYSADRYGIDLQHLYVGDGFNPEIGFLRRESFRRSYGQLRFSPRPKDIRVVRKYSYEASADYITDVHNVLESRELGAAFRVNLSSGDSIDIDYVDSFDLLRNPFAIVSGVTIAPGGYDFAQIKAKYTMGPQRRRTGTFTLARGSFYDGTNTELGYNGRVVLNAHLSVEPRLSVNWIDLAAGAFAAKLASARTNYAFTAHMALSALLQYTSTSGTLSSNVRFRWEYRPGSDFFLVYSDGRDTEARRGIPALQNRSMAVKLTRLLRF